GRLRPCAGRSAWTRDTADRGWFPVENPRSSAEAVSRAQAVTREVRRGRHGPLPFRLHLDEAPDRPRSAGDVDSRRARLDDFSWLAPARIERNGAMDLQHGTGDGGPRARPGRKAAAPLVQLAGGPGEIDAPVLARERRSERRTRMVLRDARQVAALEPAQGLVESLRPGRGELRQE